MDATPEQHPHTYARLAALEGNLALRGCTCHLDGDALTVVAPVGDGPRLADEITCRPRDDADGEFWFWTSWGRPIAPADHVVDAAVEIVGLLRPRVAAPVAGPGGGINV